MVRVFGFGLDEPLGPSLFSGFCWLRGGYRPYFENYTVDASIFWTGLRTGSY
jgi:hypothetical protein